MKIPTLNHQKESNVLTLTLPPSSQQLPTGLENTGDQQQGHRDTDEDERDVVLQMDTENNDSEASAQPNDISQNEPRSPSPDRGSYDNAMASLEKLSQLQAQIENPEPPGTKPLQCATRLLHMVVSQKMQRSPLIQD